VVILDEVIKYIASATTFAGLVTNIVRMMWLSGSEPTPVLPPPWVSPVVAVLSGVGGTALLVAMDRLVFDGAVIAMCVWVGFVAAGAAVGVTETARRTMRMRK
jgi:hypothetical protein